MGKENNDINPNKRIMIDTTVDKTGLSINLFIMPVGFVVNRQSSIVSHVSLANYILFLIFLLVQLLILLSTSVATLRSSFCSLLSI
jgi:hypothetical protein